MLRRQSIWPRKMSAAVVSPWSHDGGSKILKAFSTRRPPHSCCWVCWPELICPRVCKCKPINVQSCHQAFDQIYMRNSFAHSQRIGTLICITIAKLQVISSSSKQAVQVHKHVLDVSRSRLEQVIQRKSGLCCPISLQGSAQASIKVRVKRELKDLAAITVLTSHATFQLSDVCSTRQNGQERELWHFLQLSRKCQNKDAMLHMHDVLLTSVIANYLRSSQLFIQRTQLLPELCWLP